MPVTLPIVMGGGALVGGLVQGGFGYLANREQTQAQDRALRAQLRDAQRQREFNAAQAERANQLIGGSTGQAAGSLQDGYTQGLQALQNGYGNANGALQQGLNGAGRQLNAGYGAAQGALSPLMQLQQYGAQAGQFAQSGGRLGELLQGDLSRQNAYAGFEADPGYQFRQQQGEQAIQRAAAAQGGRMGGRTLQALTDYNQGLASQEYGNFAARRGQLNALQAQGAGQMDQSQLATLMGLGNVGYGAQMQSSELQRQLGVGQSGLTMGGAQAMAGNNAALGQGVAGMQTGLGSGLANLYATAGANQAGNLTGVANQGTQLTGMTIPQYGAAAQGAGSQWAGAGNAVNSTLNNLASLYMMNQGGGGGGYGQTWADIGNTFYR